jgi:hypothetical protein
MGKFADGVKSEGDWERKLTPKALEDCWVKYINSGRMVALSDALFNTEQNSKQRQFYNNTLEEATEKRVAAEANAKTKSMPALLRELDRLADLIEAQGSLYLAELAAVLVFRGDWQPSANTSIPTAHLDQCNKYNLKHFGVDKKAAWYLGDFKADYNAVKALEEKAITDGLAVPGACVFCFNRALGWDGENGIRGTINTNCIRVDSIGTNQHSHPIPEKGHDYVSHEKLVCTAIVEAIEKKQMDRLVEIAKYLTTIGASNEEYKVTTGPVSERLRNAVKKGMQLPKCKFWK